jgi:hypothetical protein
MIQQQNGFSGNMAALQVAADKSYLTVLEFRNIFLGISFNLHLKCGFVHSAELGPGEIL